MAVGVKHRLSNGIAWSGFAATSFTLLYLAPRLTLDSPKSQPSVFSNHSAKQSYAFQRKFYVTLFKCQRFDNGDSAAVSERRVHMKSLILALLAATLFPPMQMPSASVRRVLIGIGSAILVNSVMRDREHNDVSDYAYDHHDRYRWSSVNEFPAFRCRDNSVQCAMREGSGSVKGLFGSRRRIALTDAADMGDVSKKRCSVDLVFLLAIPR